MYISGNKSPSPFEASMTTLKVQWLAKEAAASYIVVRDATGDFPATSKELGRVREHVSTLQNFLGGFGTD